MTTKFKHTPGPWEFDPAYYEVNDTAGRRIAGVNYNDPVEVKQANARLIAAAPELLVVALLERALNAAPFKEARALLEQHGWKYEDRYETSASEFVARLRSEAINKATGNTQT